MAITSDKPSAAEAHDKQVDEAGKERILERTKQFLYYMDHGKGWDSCKAYCTDNATFDCQCDALKGIETVAAYALWMQDFGENVTPGFDIHLHSCSISMENLTVTYVATFHGKHTGPNGPVPATNKECHTDYVYLVKLEDDNDNKVESVTKIWNDAYCMKQLGWM